MVMLTYLDYMGCSFGVCGNRGMLVVFVKFLQFYNIAS